MLPSLVVAALALPFSPPSAPCAPGEGLEEWDALEEALFAFLNDQRVESTGLLESYRAHPDLPEDFRRFLEGERPAYLYDQALCVLALLERGRDEDRALAASLLDAMLGLQLEDGSVPDAVHVETLVAGEGPYSTGNQAWVLLAFVQGYESLGSAAYLRAASDIASYVLERTPSALGYGGFRLHPETVVVSTEHNLDLVAALTRLASHLPEEGEGLRRADALSGAAHARLFCESMFDPLRGLSWTGTDGGGVLALRSPIPLDPQSWSSLVFGREKWRAGLEWTLSPAPDGLWTRSQDCARLEGVEVVGPAFSDHDSNEVWFEGLAQMACALALDGQAEAAESALRVLDAVRRAAPHGDGRGLPATFEELATGFGFSYFESLHIGASAWAAFATLDSNPYWDHSLSAGYAAHPLHALPTISIDAPREGIYACRNDRYQPCFLEVRGDSRNLVGAGHELWLLIEPAGPGANGSKYVQGQGVNLQADGRWTGVAQLGNAVYPAQPGDLLRIHVVATEVGSPPSGVYTEITRASMPGLVAVAGTLSARVR